MKLARSSSCPSKILTTMAPTPAVKPMKRCGNCGGFGHNRRTCTVPEHYAAICNPTPPPPPAHKMTQKQCGLCGLMGHNRRTCGIFEKVKKTQKQCGHCGLLGHNRRTCPQMNEVKPTPVTTKSYTTTQLFARLPNYIIPDKVKKPPALEGLKGCKRLFKEPKVSPLPSAAERRAATSLASLLD